MNSLRISSTFFLLVSHFLAHSIANAAEQVVLLDTTEESSLAWTQYPYGPSAATPGWIEESFTNFDKGINWRSYVVCDVAYNNVNNWLWTPFIERGPANRIYIEIQFSMRDCNLFPGTALSCKETFSLLYYEFDAVTKEPPPWEQESYTLIDRIAADEGRFTLNNEVIINTEVRSIPVTKKGVYFAFRDQGACISLLAIKVYYITCPEVTASFAFFPGQPTGRDLTSIEQAEGKCVANSVEISPPRHYQTTPAKGPSIYAMCKGDGKWYLLSGGCQCKPGYEPDHSRQTCNVCPPGRYKPENGDGRCGPCPEHSTAPYTGSGECRCNTGYFRAETDPRSTPCTKPPSAPQNLTLNFVDQSTVMLSWSSPKFLGGRIDTVYRVACDSCPYGVTYIPNTERFNETKITISGLNAVSQYHFKVFAENGVSVKSGDPEYVEITVTTEASVPLSVRNVRVTSVTSAEITLMWESPDDPFNELEMYEIRYFARGREANATIIRAGRVNKYVVENLKQKTDYGIQIRAKTVSGWGEFSQVVYKRTGQLLALVGPEADYSRQGLLITVIAVAVALVLVFLVIAAALFFRGRGNDDCNKKQPSDCDTLEYRNGEELSHMDSPQLIPTHIPNMSYLPESFRLKSYIDPHTYEDVNQAVREFAREIDPSCISIEAIIGGGEFGDVCKGKLRLAGRTEIDVAIKTLKPGSSDKCKMDFLTEASIMGQFEHPNVIFLQGVVTKTSPVMIITEYMENGSLDTFLRANDGKFAIIQLVGMLRGIAAGMQYLSEMNYVHRDLAARNILVNAQLVCKIADFGLSREIESATEGAYTTRGGKIPVRWTAPEAIAYRKFTSASDVWSFGIVCWEVMSYGERPYWNWSNQDVIKSIDKGYRLPPPMECPEPIYQLMLDCWHKERSHRPTFSVTVCNLDQLIRLPDSLSKLAPNRTNEASALYDSVDEWLESIKMGRYSEFFSNAGISSVDSVVNLTVQDLAAIGVTLVGHQRKIINSIQAIRNHLAQGFLV
ncbi:ephrin type-B receptor 2 isoform X1 [Folsomia candida]|uniref:ephrin type-B receptor 2 isoform X1 n=1 Tax=Folsomia candida TaxID=158441 RepID=UPI000B8F51D4|nr:ephrin type-B receptor 2 isoform X1 [Folsomia candida]XP_021955228.1 ephrin type-B receptor 2 isoform X1 [Folsomia candida]XP_021955229.1 ephrin type-B receptor 2 isoform X1 [Folsomia candida]